MKYHVEVTLAIDADSPAHAEQIARSLMALWTPQNIERIKVIGGGGAAQDVIPLENKK